MTENVIYRQQQPAPTEPGWYYAKIRVGISPVYVGNFDSGLMGCFPDGERFEIGRARWLGRVDECREEITRNATLHAALQAEMASKELGPSNSSPPPKNSSTEPVSADNHAGSPPAHPVHVREEPAATVKESLTVGQEPTDVEVERVARAIADADGEDYMEDCRRFDHWARAAISAMNAPAKGN